VAREELFKYLETSKKVYIEKSDQYFQTEREVFSTVSSLHDKRENLFPDALYVITGGLFGSIIARKRNILVKVIAPLVCGLISFRIIFPQTSTNVFGFLDDAEKQNLPDVYTKQTELINQAEAFVKKTSETADESSKGFSDYLDKAKKTLGEYTGLNVDQSISNKKK
jgi:organizing structure protein 2